MPSYVLYLPNRQGADPLHLAAVGLDDLASDKGPEFSDCFEGGPDGGRGLLVAWRTGDIKRDPPLDARKFTWQAAKADTARGLAAERFYFGVVAGENVTPADIARRDSVAGYPVTLKDGQIWRIPAAQHLPHRHGLGNDGRYSRQVEDRYADFWQQSEGYAVEFFRALDQLDLLKAARKIPAGAEDAVSFTLEDAWNYCCRALAINYRVTPEIVDFLGLLDDAAMRNVIKATIDLIAILETRDQKKTDELLIAVG
jgi:hypothetical protein